jgi:histidyl-tRNA synthetase
VLNQLRKNKIPVVHSLAKDKMAGQSMATERGGTIKTILIMGKKEAMEDSVIVRDALTHAQETIFIKDLTVYLKKHRL